MQRVRKNVTMTRSSQRTAVDGQCVLGAGMNGMSAVQRRKSVNTGKSVLLLLAT